jgi:hypothetical protein
VAPISFPNDGVFFINPPNAAGDFTGTHYRPPFDNTPIEGRFTPATGGQPAHITFTETYSGVTYTYAADIIEFKPTFFVTFNGKRRAAAPAGTTDDDWVGTHTT